MLKVALQFWLTDFTANEALSVEDCVGWVGVERVLGGITDSGRRVNVTPKYNAT